jgi:hypothetical protein
MDDETCKKLGIMTEGERTKIEEDGITDTVRYFDRIHDKLFQLNTIILGAYFALIAINRNLSVWLLLIPILTIFLLLFVDYKMMEKSRLQSRFKSFKNVEVEKYGRLIKAATRYSLLSIVVTVLVTLFFVYLLVANGFKAEATQAKYFKPGEFNLNTCKLYG